MRPLDLEDVQAFAKVADFLSFTRAADELNTTQSAISTRIKRLEERLDIRLLERTPRKVRLSPKGKLFLDHAHKLLSMQELVVNKLSSERMSIRIGVSQYVIGSNLPILLKCLHDAHPNLMIETYMGSSRDVEARFDSGQIDAAFVLRHQDSREEGQILLKEHFGWMAQQDWAINSDKPVKLALHAPPCRVRAMALDALEAAQVPWIEVFGGSDAATVSAAVQAGLAVGVLVQKQAPVGSVDVGPQLGLPTLPSRDVVLYANTSDIEIRTAINLVADVFRVGFARSPMHTVSGRAVRGHELVDRSVS